MTAYKDMTRAQKLEWARSDLREWQRCIAERDVDSMSQLAVDFMELHAEFLVEQAILASAQPVSGEGSAQSEKTK